MRYQSDHISIGYWFCSIADDSFSVIVVGVAVFGTSAWLINSQRSSLTSGLQSTALLRAQDLASAIEDGTIPTDIAVKNEDSSFVQVINLNGTVVASSENISGELSLASKIPVSKPLPSTHEAIYRQGTQIFVLLF